MQGSRATHNIIRMRSLSRLYFKFSVGDGCCFSFGRTCKARLAEFIDLQSLEEGVLYLAFLKK